MMRIDVIAVLFFVRDDELAMLFLMISLCLIGPAIMGISCTTRHCLFDRFFKVPEEDEFHKRTRELVELRRKHEAAVRAYPQEEDALEQLFNQARQEVIDRPKPEEPKPVRSSSYD